MIIAFAEAGSGVPVYINPSFVVSLRPDPAEPARTTVVRLSDGETLRLRGGHDEVAARRPTGASPGSRDGGTRRRLP
jgi:hypothetical protein